MILLTGENMHAFEWQTIHALNALPPALFEELADQAHSLQKLVLLDTLTEEEEQLEADLLEEIFEHTFANRQFLYATEQGIWLCDECDMLE